MFGNIYFAWTYYIMLATGLPNWFDGETGNFVGVNILHELEKNWINAYLWTIYWSFTTMVSGGYGDMG